MVMRKVNYTVVSFDNGHASNIETYMDAAEARNACRDWEENGVAAIVCDMDDKGRIVAHNRLF